MHLFSLTFGVPSDVVALTSFNVQHSQKIWEISLGENFYQFHHLVSAKKKILACINEYLKNVVTFWQNLAKKLYFL